MFANRPTCAGPQLMTCRWQPRMSPTGGAIGAALVISTAGAMVTPLLPVYVVDSLGAGLQAVGFVVAAPLVGMMVVQPLAGQLADHYGRRILVLVGVVVMAFATIGYAFISSLIGVGLLRFAAGAGTGLVIVATLAAVIDEAPEARRGEQVSLYTLATNSGGAAGPLIGGALATWMSFSSVVVASALVAAFGGLPGRRLPKPPESDHELGVFRASTHGLVHSAAAVPGGVLAICFAGAAAMYTLLPLFLAQLESGGAGIALATFALFIIAVRSLGRQLPDRIGHARCAMVSLVLVGVGLVTMSIVNSLATVLIATAIIGIGHGFAYPSLAAAVTLRCGPHERATALGTFTALTTAGLVAWSIALGMGASALGFRPVFALAGAAMALGVPLVLKLRA